MIREKHEKKGRKKKPGGVTAEMGKNKRRRQSKKCERNREDVGQK